MSTYPEHEKLRAIKDQSQSIGEFLDWLEEKSITLCTLETKGEGIWTTNEYFPVRKSIQDLLAEYFEIDQNKLEEEKRAMLEELRNTHAS